jgi:NAD+ diphosphatase
LLGHQKVWPEHRFSTFAGFVETGESFEQCVSREVAEEAGVLVSDVKYLGSQPWPFPASLMIAFEATIVDPENARPDGEEIEEIRWFDRDSIIEEIQAGELLLPPKISVARAMIESWYNLVPLADGSARPTFESIESAQTLESWRK